MENPNKTKMRQNKSTTKSKTSSVQEMMKRLAEFAKSANSIDATAEEHMRTDHGMNKQQTGHKQESGQ